MIKSLIIVTCLFYSLSCFSQTINNNSEYFCDIEILREVKDSLKNNTEINYSIFFSTFDISCKQNVEFSEWSNELLFEVLYFNPEKFIINLSNKQSKINLILSELYTPVADHVFDNLIAKIEKLNFLKNSKESILKERIVKALKKEKY